MTPLMPKRTVWMKWVRPYALILLVFSWTFYDKRPDYISAGLVFISMLVIMFFVSKRQKKHMPDQVLDGGSFLQVTFGRVTEHIPLSNVASGRAKNHTSNVYRTASSGAGTLRRHDHLLPFSGS